VKLIVAEKTPKASPSSSQPTIVRRLLAWAQRADAGERAEAASALARAYRYSNLPEPLRREAVVGLTAMLEDSSILVRRALAEALASAHDAPHHIISALANDLPEIAAIVLALSPVLTDAELVDSAAIGDASVQTALARRPFLSVGVAAALAEIGRREAVIALVENPDARLTPRALNRIVERFGEDGEAREALLARPQLPATLRCELVAATARALSPFAAAFGLGAERIERVMREASEEGAISVAAGGAHGELADLAHHLRQSGALTAALLMRALISGNGAFFSAAAAELSGLTPGRVAGIIRDPFGPGFGALHRRMGLTAPMLAPFRVALASLPEFEGAASARAFRPIIARVIGVCEAARSSDLAKLLSLLRRIEAEAALEEARAFADDVAATAPFVAHEADDWLKPMVLIDALDAAEAAPPALAASDETASEAGFDAVAYIFSDEWIGEATLDPDARAELETIDPDAALGASAEAIAEAA
jgi:uncharacterized protein (DUF2336 family)